jgi:MFS family permease
MRAFSRNGWIPWRRDYRSIIVAILLFGSIVNYLDRVNLSIANATIAGEFGLDPARMGILLSAFMWAYALANLPAGWLLDRYGTKSIFLWSSVAWSLATIAGGFVGGFLSMALVRVVLGVAEAPFFICAGRFTQQWFTEKERGGAASIINLGPKIANGFAPPLLTFMMLAMGWRSMFIALGAVGFLLSLAWLKFYREDFGPALSQPRAAGRRNGGPPNSYFLALLRQPGTWWFNLGNVGSSYVFWLYFTWLPTYLTTGRGMTATQAGWATMVPFLAGVAAVPIGGFLSDYLVQRGMDVIRARLVPTVGGCLLSALAAAPVNYVHNANLAVALTSVSLFAGALRVGVLWAMVGDMAPPEAVGVFGGIQNFASFVGAALAPLGTGFILKATDSYDIVFGTGAVLCALGALSYLMIGKRITFEDLTGAAQPQPPPE